MKQQRLLLGVGLVGICILVWWLFFSQPSESARKVRQQKAKQATKAPQPKSASQGATTNALAKPKSKLERSREILQKENHRPIEFYGKAVDQYGQPVVDAEAICRVLIHDGYREESENHEARTGADGAFSFDGFNGERMAILLQKEGYEQDLRPSATNGFTYSLMSRPEEIHHPDPSNPVIFNMWKLAGAEPMVEVEGFYGVSVDGKTYTFDLLRKKKIENADGNGDLRVKVNRPSQIAPKSKYDWSFIIEAVDGGIRETDETFKYLAPEGGYQSFLEIPINAEDPAWSERFKKSIYLKSRGGKFYGRLDIEVFSNYQNDGVFRVKGYVNPNGSRNLEWDPEKRISVDRIAQIGLEKAVEEAKGRKLLTDEEEAERLRLGK